VNLQHWPPQIGESSSAVNSLLRVFSGEFLGGSFFVFKKVFLFFRESAGHRIFPTKIV
jgi:hypothetical protein